MFELEMEGKHRFVQQNCKSAENTWNLDKGTLLQASDEYARSLTLLICTVTVLHGYCQGKHFGLRDVEKREEREAAVNLVVYTRRCLVS